MSSAPELELFHALSDIQEAIWSPLPEEPHKAVGFELEGKEQIHKCRYSWLCEENIPQARHRVRGGEREESGRGEGREGEETGNAQPERAREREREEGERDEKPAAANETEQRGGRGRERETEREGGGEGPRVGERATGWGRRNGEKVGRSRRKKVRGKKRICAKINNYRREGEGKQLTGRKGRESWVERGKKEQKKSFLVGRHRWGKQSEWMTGQERTGTGGNQLFSKAFSTQASGFLWTCTRKAHKQRDTTDFVSTSTTLRPAPASAASSTSNQPTAMVRLDTNQHQPDSQATHLWTAGETSRLLGVQT